MITIKIKVMVAWVKNGVGRVEKEGTGLDMGKDSGDNCNVLFLDLGEVFIVFFNDYYFFYNYSSYFTLCFRHCSPCFIFQINKVVK